MGGFSHALQRCQADVWFLNVTAGTWNASGEEQAHWPGRGRSAWGRHVQRSSVVLDETPAPWPRGQNDVAGLHRIPSLMHSCCWGAVVLCACATRRLGASGKRSGEDQSLEEETQKGAK